MSSRRFGKRGNFTDMIFLVVALVVSIIGIIFGFLIWSSLNDKFQATDVIPTEAKAASSTFTDNYKASFNVGFLILWLGLFGATLISAYFIDTHPAFFFLSLIAYIIVLVAFIPIVNSTQEILSDPQIAATTAQFPLILWFANNFFKIIVAQGIMILIALYAKMRSEI